MAEKKSRDFYAILGIEKTANQGQIKQAYRKSAMKYHPDKNPGKWDKWRNFDCQFQLYKIYSFYFIYPGNEEAAEKFKELAVAYEVLSDPNKKRQYDLHGGKLRWSTFIVILSGPNFPHLISKNFTHL